MRIDVTSLVDGGLGNSAYLVDLGDGRGLVVDASRDLRPVRAAAAERGVRVAYAVDTHLHADFLTGAVQLAADDHAQVIASARGHREFPHVGLDDGDEVDLGGLRMRAIGTPGHTDEHLAYLLLDGQVPVGVFSGGSLIVGSAARTDLLGAERTDELTRAQYRSLQRLTSLPDDVVVWPTHGAGSFCSAPAGGRRTTTIGAERAGNPLLAAPDEDTFVAALLGSLGSYPTYFSRLSELNRRGPAVLDVAAAGRLAPLPTPAVQQLRDSGAVIVDVRPVADFSAAHIPGAISIPLRPQFATWLGWLVPPGTPLVVVRNPDQDPAEVAWQARKVGYDQLAGELSGGMSAWRGAGVATRSIPLVTAGQLPDIATGNPEILDVRQDSEFRAGHLPGARHVELGALAGRAAGLPTRPTVVMCGHGERAMGAASLLARAGRTQLAVLTGGPQDWSSATERPLASGA
ncbi:MBL fold metallo-hydrolase [Geodermatophilus ruber]|uniref:Glyoxylase, beta-lactamase superfamily II n=1 Tax=Geodermatophilus ruber TaxID=504800 RepID=A0A1I4CB83_9ACTN|nr:MBL fold metallo-hydrolase [Geodermatophilus ruber]SFK78402.1 Glyoxylase, beta-lactamase superfamily II [Geodermatophilus ruber]